MDSPWIAREKIEFCRVPGLKNKENKRFPAFVVLPLDRLVLVADGRVEEFAGSLDDYRDLLLGRGAKKIDDIVVESKAKSGNRKDERRAAAQMRERTKHLRAAAREAEKGMTLLTEQRTDLIIQMITSITFPVKLFKIFSF